jgi:hypothetical protein
MSDDEVTQPSVMPAQPKTQELPAADKQDILLAEMRRGFGTVNTRLDQHDTKLDKAITEGIEANVRLDRVETRLGKAEGRLDTVEERAGRSSTGMRGLSGVDLRHESQIALLQTQLTEERARTVSKDEVADLVRKANKEQTGAIVLALTSTAKEAANNPMVRKIGYALAGLVLLAANAATTYLVDRARHSDTTSITNTVTK